MWCSTNAVVFLKERGTKRDFATFPIGVLSSLSIWTRLGLVVLVDLS